MKQFQQSLGLVILLALGVMPQIAWGCANDPSWQNTMRCRAFPAVWQTPPPPPAPPAIVDHIADYTRVDLPWANANNRVLRCVDGTQPVIYVDEAVSGESNDWLITFQGGGSCSNGEDCFETYLDVTENAEMGSALQPAMKNMQGIHSTEPLNLFSEFNRIRIHKCGYDRYNGTSTVRNLSATIDPDQNENGVQGELINAPNTPDYNALFYSVQEGSAHTFDLFHHGKQHVLHTLDQLETGLSYTTWIDDNGSVSSETASLPPMQDASKILFAGHSGGAHGLMNNIDDLVDYMSGWTQSDGQPFMGDVRALFDAQFLPTVESEAAFTEHLDGDVYDQLTSCQPPCKSGPPLHYTYDAKHYFTSAGAGGYFDGPNPEWMVPLDSSCLAVHQSDPWRCADRFHVLFNHMTTPYFMREDFSDPAGQHNDNPAGEENYGHQLFWADAKTRHCPESGATNPCVPRLSQADYRVRIEEQARRLASDFKNRSELAQSGLPIPSVYLWLPDCASHAGAFDTHQFFNVGLKSDSLWAESTMHDFLWLFVNDDTEDKFKALIDGVGDLRSICRPVP